MNNMNDILSDYGVNLSEVMERFVDDEELYLDCLYSFLDDPNFEELEKSIQNKDYEAAFNYAHTLKGVTSNLGLAPLLQVIVEIVEALRNHIYTNLDKQVDAVCIEHNKLKKLLSR